MDGISVDNIFSGHRVLIGEENAIQSSVFMDTLYTFGPEYETAVTGEELLAKLAAAEPGRYSLAIVDIALPGISGIEVCRRFRSSGHPDAGSLPFIGITSEREDRAYEAAYAAGFNAMAVKPLARDSVRAYYTIFLKERYRYARVRMLPAAEKVETAREQLVDLRMLLQDNFYIGRVRFRSDKYSDVLEPLYESPDFLLRMPLPDRKVNFTTWLDTFTSSLVHPDDRMALIVSTRRERVVDVLMRQKAHFINFRMRGDDAAWHRASMKWVPICGAGSNLDGCVVGIYNIDETVESDAACRGWNDDDGHSIDVVQADRTLFSGLLSHLISASEESNPTEMIISEIGREIQAERFGVYYLRNGGGGQIADLSCTAATPGVPTMPTAMNTIDLAEIPGFNAAISAGHMYSFPNDADPDGKVAAAMRAHGTEAFVAAPLRHADGYVIGFVAYRFRDRKLVTNRAMMNVREAATMVDITRRLVHEREHSRELELAYRLSRLREEIVTYASEHFRLEEMLSQLARRVIAITACDGVKVVSEADGIDLAWIRDDIAEGGVEGSVSSPIELNVEGKAWGSFTLVHKMSTPVMVGQVLKVCARLTEFVVSNQRLQLERAAGSEMPSIFAGELSKEVMPIACKVVCEYLGASRVYLLRSGENLNTGKFVAEFRSGDDIAPIDNGFTIDLMKESVEVAENGLDVIFAPKARDPDTINRFGLNDEINAKLDIRSIYVYKFNVNVGGVASWGSMGITYEHRSHVLSEGENRFALVATRFFRLAAERIARQRQLAAERDRALAADRAKSYFFSTVSHDIRTPLNAIIGYSQMLKAGISDESERKDAVNSILVSSQTLLELINDVLDLSKLEAGKMEIMPEPVDATKLLLGVIDAFKATLGTKDVRLLSDLKPMPPLKLDPQRIRQILFNLVGNAVKYTDHGSITVGAAWSDGTFSFYVADTGCGMSDEDLRRIADPYVQVGSAKSRNGGTGLGVTICRQLVGRMKGTIQVASGVGVGTRFDVAIPNVESAAEEIKRRLSTTQKIKLSAARKVTGVKRVLVVDDSPVNLSVIRAMLRRFGITDVITAANGREALQKLKAANTSATPAAERFDLVLSDLWMPEMDGEGLVRAIRGDPDLSALPVYALTADVEAPQTVQAVGFTGVVLKPLTLEKLGEIFA